MWSSKEFNFFASRTHAFYKPVDFIGLARGLPYLADDDVAVDVALDVFAVSLVADQTVFLAVVQPVSRSSRSDYSLKLVSLYPNQFLHLFT